MEVFQAPRHMSRSFLAIVFLLVTGTCALAITGLFVPSEISAEWALRGPGMPYHFQFWRVVVLFVAGGALAYALAQAAAAIEEGARAPRTQFLAASFFGSFAVFLFGQYIEQNVSQCFNQVESCPFPLAGPQALVQDTQVFIFCLGWILFVCFAIALVDFLLHPPPRLPA
ncbi:MAG TPA: hypothetical protein DEV93_22490 [Chloroflexi bacterium]|nr:hypothetical protein [Chloroflexota bacterium]